jgi:HSP20 family molecular chaperone IbpA
MDVTDDGGLMIEFDVPGVDTSTLTVNVTRNELVVSGERTQQRFRKSLSFDHDHWDAKSGTAEYVNGVLSLRFEAQSNTTIEFEIPVNVL